MSRLKCILELQENRKTYLLQFFTLERRLSWFTTKKKLRLKISILGLKIPPPPPQMQSISPAPLFGPKWSKPPYFGCFVRKSLKFRKIICESKQTKQLVTTKYSVESKSALPVRSIYQILVN